MYIILNHMLVQAEKALIPVSDRGFRYGDGAFETIAVQGGVPYRIEWHLSRLKKGLEAIRIGTEIDFLWDECRILLHANKVQDGLLRIQVTRGSGGRGYLPSDNVISTCVVETLPTVTIPSEPVSLMASSYTKIPAATLPTYKHCNGLSATLARMEATDYDCFDALMLGEGGSVAETSSANIFWVKNKKLFTPKLECGALSGSVRSVLLERSPYPAEETRATVATLASADSVFITNVAWKVLAVNELKPIGLRWDSARTAQMFLDLLNQDMAKYVHEQQAQWQDAKAA